MKREFKRGNRVYSKFFGTGTVIKFLGKQYDFPIEVKFDSGIECYTKKGEYLLETMKNYAEENDKNINFH